MTKCTELTWHLFQAAAGQQLWAGAGGGGGGGEGAAQEQGGGRWLPGPGLPRPAGLRRLPETQNKVDTSNIRIPHLLDTLILLCIGPPKASKSRLRNSSRYQEHEDVSIHQSGWIFNPCYNQCCIIVETDWWWIQLMFCL